MCVYVCPDGYYIQNVTGNRTCVSSCLANNYIDYVKKMCVGTCPYGSFSYTNGTCLNNCPSGYYADENLNICNTTCAGGLFRDPTTLTCVTQCPPGYFRDLNNGDYLCRKTCSNTN